MTWSMFTIGWLELGDTEKAREVFYRQLENKRQPFNVRIFIYIKKLGRIVPARKIFVLKFHKMLGRIANREDPDQTASLEAV